MCEVYQESSPASMMGSFKLKQQGIIRAAQSLVKCEDYKERISVSAE